MDTSPRYGNDRKSGQFRNQRIEYGHFAKECRKPKRAKDYVYHKEKMMLCKQEEKGVPLSAEQDIYVVETVDSNVTPDSSDKCDNDAQADQNAKEPEDERVLLASLIANFKLDLDENKKLQRKLKKANTSITQELQKSKQDLAKTKQDLEKSKQDLETSKQDLESSKQNLTYYKRKSSFANPLYLKKAQKEKPCLYNVKYDKNDLANIFAPEYDETIRLAEESRSKLCKTMVRPYDYTKQNSLYELFTPQTEKSHEQLFLPMK
ncbi:hypothetical protein Tco_0936510 [Tanacetum coccineum]